MRALVTGSSGHLGEALVRVLRASSHEVVGLDIAASPHTDVAGSITDVACVRESMRGADVVLHAATLHKPHLVTHSRQQFVETNVSGTLTLLEEAVRAGVRAFRLHELDERVRGCVAAAGGQSRGMGHRRRGARSEEHLRRN